MYNAKRVANAQIEPDPAHVDLLGRFLKTLENKVEPSDGTEMGDKEPGPRA